MWKFSPERTERQNLSPQDQKLFAKMSPLQVTKFLKTVYKYIISYVSLFYFLDLYFKFTAWRLKNRKKKTKLRFNLF